jgi:hypothetical protein
MTHTTTAFGVSGMSIYMNQPVAVSAIPILKAICEEDKGVEGDRNAQ